MSSLSETSKPASSGADPKWDPDARLGTEVDKYTLVRLLGRGGMGAVYEARHARLARRVAIKFLLPQFASNPDVLKRFENEAQAAGGLEHPNVAAVTDFGRADDGSPYLVMEYLQGCDCSSLLARHGTLPPFRVANIVMQACRGLQAAHRAGIVHRDLKPENLFVTQAGDGSDWVKVLDFGIAKLRPTDASVMTGTGVTMGTAFYMSPEQARGAAQVDQRTDVWSLGVVLYELLSGCKPFRGEQFLHIIHQILSAEPEPLATLAPELDRGLVAVVERAMEKELSRRWQSVDELAAALLPFAGKTVLPRAEPFALGLVETQPSPATTVGGVAIGNSSAPGPLASSSSVLRTPGRSVVRWGIGASLAATIVVVLAGLVWPALRSNEANDTREVGETRAEPSAVSGSAPNQGANTNPATAVQPMPAPPVSSLVASSPTSALPVASGAPMPSGPKLMRRSPAKEVFERPSSNTPSVSSNTPSTGSNDDLDTDQRATAPVPSVSAPPTPVDFERPARTGGATKPAIEIEPDNPYDH